MVDLLRNKSVLPNHRLYNPNKENERENYLQFSAAGLCAMKLT